MFLIGVKAAVVDDSQFSILCKIVSWLRLHFSRSYTVFRGYQAATSGEYKTPLSRHSNYTVFCDSRDLSRRLLCDISEFTVF